MPIAGALIENFKNNPLVWLWRKSSEDDGGEVAPVMQDQESSHLVFEKSDIPDRMNCIQKISSTNLDK